jgi:transposase
MAVLLRRDFDAARLRGLAKKTKDGPQARRLLALAAIYDGATRTEAAKIGGVGLQNIRDWVLRFNARGPDGLLNGKAPGQPSKLNDAQRQMIARMIESGPIPAIHGVVRWRLIDLAQWIFEECRITIAKQTLSRELRAMGYRKLSRPWPQCASGSGRNWMCTARGLLPLPPSISHGVLSPLVLHSPRPFQPAFGSSMRPSKPLA